MGDRITEPLREDKIPALPHNGEVSLDNGAGAGTLQPRSLLLAHEEFEEITASHDYKELLHGARNP